MRIAVTISYTKNWGKLADICVPNMAKYCVKHGYSLFVTVDEYKEYNGLCKMNNILRLMKGNTLNRFDCIFSFDCDTLITNHNFKLEYCIDLDKAISVSEGGNMGVFGVVNNRNGVEYIQRVQEYIILGHLKCEQDAIDLNSDDIAVFDHPAFNSYLSQFYPEVPQTVTKEQGQWEPGCFVLHLPALPLEQRINLMKEYSKYIVL